MADLMAMTWRDWVLRYSTKPELLGVDPEAAIALDRFRWIIGTIHSAELSGETRFWTKRVGALKMS